MGERHKHADVIIAWANGEEVQGKFERSDIWVGPDKYCNGVPLFNQEGMEFRIKPKTVILKREGWLNIYAEREVYCYPTKDDADHNAANGRLACIFIEWEEEHDLDEAEELQMRYLYGENR